MLTENRIDIRSLVRDFGDTRVLHDVSFSVQPGRLTGFVGANGAGKTTTMRIVLGVLATTAGDVLWAGAPITPDVRRQFGYMPEERGLYPKMKVAEQLRYFARLHGADAATATDRTTALLDRLGLGDRVGDTLETLSLGNQQRVQIAASLVHEPVALVLDEPFSGLDPLAVDVMAEVLREQAGRGVPVLFSSHQLELVERLCDDVVILSHGHVVAAGTADGLRSGAGGSYVLRVPASTDLGWLPDVPGVRVLDVGTGGAEQQAVFAPESADAVQHVLRAALDRGEVRELSRRTPTLAEIFREAVA